ncbi:hypothetical protein [Streptomyces sp. NPDC060035]|uniref:hypothetical protein n=1 Tax=Streptomyces sp. NPDC060035 TaxID=3347044 RepID=UPI0036748420
MTHRQALGVERATLTWMRALSAPALTAEQMPQGGHSETAAAGLVPPEKLWTQVKALAIQHEGVPLRVDT